MLHASLYFIAVNLGCHQALFSCNFAAFHQHLVGAFRGGYLIAYKFDGISVRRTCRLDRRDSAGSHAAEVVVQSRPTAVDESWRAAWMAE